MGDADGVAGDTGVTAGIVHRHVLEQKTTGILDGRHVRQVGVDDAFDVVFARLFRPTAVNL